MKILTSRRSMLFLVGSLVIVSGNLITYPASIDFLSKNSPYPFFSDECYSHVLTVADDKNVTVELLFDEVRKKIEQEEE